MEHYRRVIISIGVSRTGQAVNTETWNFNKREPYLCTMSILLLSLAILAITNFFHPLNYFSIKLLLDSDMHHCSCRCGTVPMLFIRWQPNNITRINLFNRVILTLHPTASCLKAQVQPMHTVKRQRLRKGIFLYAWAKLGILHLVSSRSVLSS